MSELPAVDRAVSLMIVFGRLCTRSFSAVCPCLLRPRGPSLRSLCCCVSWLSFLGLCPCGFFRRFVLMVVFCCISAVFVLRSFPAVFLVICPRGLSCSSTLWSCLAVFPCGVCVGVFLNSLFFSFLLRSFLAVCSRSFLLSLCLLVFPTVCPCDLLSFFLAVCSCGLSLRYGLAGHNGIW